MYFRLIVAFVTLFVLASCNYNQICDNSKSVEGFQCLGGTERAPWIYYISEFNATNTAAMSHCMNTFGGYLLTILSKEQDEYIRLRLQIHGIGSRGDYVATAGKYNALDTTWQWSSVGVELIFKNFIDGGGEPQIPGQCISVAGELSSYGWHSISCTSNQTFICQFQ